MPGRKLSFIIALALFSAPIAAGCAQDPTPDPGITKTKEQPQKTDEPKKTEPQADESGLIPTDDPNVFKATKILPRPAEAANYPKPEYPQLGYESSFEGAEEVAKYLEVLLTYAFSSGEVKELEAVCESSSPWCSLMINGVKAVNEKRAWYDFKNNPEIKVTGYGIPPKDANKGEISIKMESSISAYDYFSTDKMTLRKEKSKTLIRYINLSFKTNKWVVVGVDSETKE